MKMIYLVGQPGAGKSTLMARLTAPYTRIPVEGAVPHDLLVNESDGMVVGAEIGRRRRDFSGTDALASSIIEAVIPWMNRVGSRLPLLYGEGARLGCRRFLIEAVSAGYPVILGHVEHPDAEKWRQERNTELGRAQNEAWVKGRRTAARNLASNPPPGVRVLRGHPDRLYDDIGDALRE